jgi:hypothetical protein
VRKGRKVVVRGWGERRKKGELLLNRCSISAWEARRVLWVDGGNDVLKCTSKKFRGQMLCCVYFTPRKYMLKRYKAGI